jgi:cytochrome c-type biogenesis protein CcmH/NrfG
LKRTAIALATVVAIAGCKKNEPVTAAPIAPAPGIPTAMPPGGMPPAGMPPGGMPPQAMPPGGALAGAPAGAEQRIAIAKQLVAQNPKDVQAWISLGNDYFDTKQHQAAIDAYANALALDPKNPDVLTDQGVMYRDLGQYDKAIANFLKANQVAPTHMQSLFNAGVVYAFDLKDAKRAEETWLKVIANDKSGRYAAQAGQAIAELRQRQGQGPGAPGMPSPAPGK